MDSVSDVTAFDAAILLFVSISALIGFRRGFVTEILTLAAWGGAVAITLYGLIPFSTVIRDFVRPDFIADIIALVILFFASLVALKLVASWIGDNVRSSYVGALDRAVGTLFGLLRGALLVSFAYLIFSYWFPVKNQPDWVTNARVRPLIAYGVEMLAIIGPDLLERARQDNEDREILEDMKANMPTSTFADEEGIAEYTEKARESLEGLVTDAIEKLKNGGEDDEEDEDND
ncbi:MAG: CvpA family protein [Proteobacteria bacterium]|nr:CvpA family protein [Pseudomonadota bacterium]